MGVGKANRMEVGHMSKVEYTTANSGLNHPQHFLSHNSPKPIHIVLNLPLLPSVIFGGFFNDEQNLWRPDGITIAAVRVRE